MDASLQYKPESAWKLYSTEQTQQDMRAVTDRYIDFLSTCKTEREVIKYVEEKLRAAGYGDDASQGMVVRPFRNKALFAAKRGDQPLESGLSLIAAHTDSPRLDFKQKPLIEQADVLQGQTHYYGGIKKYQWFSRPLALHGEIICQNGTHVKLVVGEQATDPVFCIADLLPHSGHQQLEKTVQDAFEAEKMKIVLGHKLPPEINDKAKEDNDANKKEASDLIKNAILDYLHTQFAIVEEDLITAEIEVVPAGAARYVGFDRAIVGGYGQDDRICVFTALEALLASANDGRSKAVMFWDKEEIGSQGATGASARFLQYCVEDLARAWAPTTPASHVLLNTQAISADVTAALDPDYQDLHEKQNAARLGFGPCFSKFTGSKGKFGASEADAEYFAQVLQSLRRQQVPWQVAELGKVDTGGGGTVALFMASWGMRVIDLGPALLAMHSPFELASCADIYATYKAYTAFLNN
ncbi:MAG: aminopeptidase [Desulfovibrionaceae bacterium]|nr:aminopeptidase [Desulfovibrionaceae bacterium]